MEFRFWRQQLIPDRRFRVNDLIRVPPDSQPEAPLRSHTKQRRKSRVNTWQGLPANQWATRRCSRGKRQRHQRAIRLPLGKNKAQPAFRGAEEAGALQGPIKTLMAVIDLEG
jgi:hypothetical protein